VQIQDDTTNLVWGENSMRTDLHTLESFLTQFSMMMAQ